MRTRYIFWDQALHLHGSREVPDASVRLRLMLASKGRFGGERLAGSLVGNRIRAWRKAPFAVTGDLVEFDGVIRPGEAGTVIDGRFAYGFGAKAQLVGVLIIALMLLVAGVMRTYSATAAAAGEADNLLWVGVIITAITLAWIYSSNRMRGEQIDFIEAKLREVVAPDEGP